MILRVGMVKSGILSRNLMLFFLAAIFACASVCKKPQNDNYLEPINVSNNPGRSENPSIAVDSKGKVHLVWNDNTPGIEQGNAWNQEILYAYKPANGPWSTPVNITNNHRASRFPCIAVDKNDIIHLAWQDASPDGYWRIFYSQKTNEGNWSVPETISTGLGDVDPELAVDSLGRVFMVWYAGGYSGALYFSIRHNDRNWTQPIVISQRGYVSKSDYPMAIDLTGRVHVAWDLWDGGHTVNVFYTMRDTNGNWTVPSIIFAIDSFAFSPVLASDKNGNVHIAWNDSTLIYMYRSPEGSWSTPEFPGINSSPDAIAIDNYGTVYMSYRGTRLFKKPKDGGWEKPIAVVEGSAVSSSLAIDNEGIKHLAWYCTPPDTIDTNEIYYVEIKNY